MSKKQDFHSDPLGAVFAQLSSRLYDYARKYFLMSVLISLQPSYWYIAVSTHMTYHHTNILIYI